MNLYFIKNLIYMLGTWLDLNSTMDHSANASTECMVKFNTMVCIKFPLLFPQ